jgi:two-component system sensor histidine kinase HydH
LASIRSSAELGLEVDDARESRELHAEVVAQADRLEGWIRQFLTASRAGSAAPALADAGAVVADCAAQFAPKLARRGVALEVAVPAALPSVRLGAIVLRQVLNSLLANAAEATPDGGRLSVAAAARGRRVTVEVSDTGPGMSPAEVASAFSLFATTKPAGLGLGLPLAREAVERHGGRLEVTSRPGAGTTVRLVLPVAPGPAGVVGA